MFTNDRTPQATRLNWSPQGPDDGKLGGTLVKRRASIGSGALFLAGVREVIGAGAIVGAGSVETHGVPNGVVLVGVPTRIVGPALAARGN